jgi:tryptophan synthase beta chain
VSDQVKFVLDEKDIPKTWYNLTADLPKPLPPVLHPGTKKPIGPADLEPLFPMELILQEVTGERYLDIPRAIRDVYRMWRPSPLIRARRLEQNWHRRRKSAKYEGVSRPARTNRTRRSRRPGPTSRQGSSG